jgi:AcrR family transcriptional regulator
MGKWQTPKGASTRAAILDAAVNIASAEGLEGLTIGRLADTLEMSKSGLFAHFGSKEDLQLATVERARDIFIERVVTPALAADEGLPRLRALCDAWLAYAKDETFRGGCFFSAVSAEFDSRPGPVKDRIAAIMREWLTGLAAAVKDAQALGHIGEADPQQVAFELHALEMGANWAFQLLGDAQAVKRARRAIHARIDGLEEKRGVASTARPPRPSSSRA